MQILKLSETTAALRRVFFILLDAATGQVKQTGKVDGDFTGFITKSDGSIGGEAGTFVEIDDTDAPGLYYYEFIAGELSDLGPIVLSITCADCLDRTVEAYVGRSAPNISSGA